MKQPTPTLLIANSGFNIETKIALWGLGNILQLAHSLLINIYKRLNANGCKRVLNGYKSLITDLGTDNQVVKKNIGIANIDGLRKSIS